MTDDFLTPLNEVYIRNHNLVPTFDEDFEDEFELEISLSGQTKKTLSLVDLKKLKKHTVITQIACAGNRRSHTRKVYPSVKGIDWKIGAIGNNSYEGVLLIDLLRASGFSESDII